MSNFLIYSGTLKLRASIDLTDEQTEEICKILQNLFLDETIKNVVRQKLDENPKTSLLHIEFE